MDIRSRSNPSELSHHERGGRGAKKRKRGRSSTLLFPLRASSDASAVADSLFRSLSLEFACAPILRFIFRKIFEKIFWIFSGNLFSSEILSLRDYGCLFVGHRFLERFLALCLWRFIVLRSCVFLRKDLRSVPALWLSPLGRSFMWLLVTPRGGGLPGR